MIRTVVAIENEGLSKIVCDTLEKNSISVRHICRTGSEACRAIHKMGGGVVICSYKLLDTTASALADDLGDMASVLLIAKPPQLSYCDNPGVFKLPVPVKSGELIGSVNMLLQMDSMRASQSISKRSVDEERIILEAKQLLIKKNGVSEEYAHRYIQKRSMESCCKVSETARRIVEALQ